MRISTSQIYDANVGNISRQQGDLLKLQNQLSTGKRVVTPSDDPVAAARALEVSQSAAQVKLHLNAQGAADNTLTSLDSKLGALGELFSYVRERAIQAGSGALNQTDRNALAVDMEAQFANLMSLANATDENGEYLFSGFKGDVLPFTGALSGVTYAGDQGQRTVHVSNTRNIPVSQSGDEVFMRIQTTGQAFNSQLSIGNTGTATIASNVVVGAYAGGQYGIRFTSASSYDIFDRAADPAMTGAALASGTYTAGVPIDLPPAPTPVEIQVTINGTPSVSDVVAVNPSSGTKDAFGMLAEFITNLKTGGSGAAYFAALQDTMGLTDNGLENALRLRAQTGSSQVEIESLGTISEDLNVQLSDRIEKLIGLDYVSAISDFQMQQTYLEASRNTFVKTTNLSLFSFIS